MSRNGDQLSRVLGEASLGDIDKGLAKRLSSDPVEGLRFVLGALENAMEGLLHSDYPHSEKSEANEFASMACMNIDQSLRALGHPRKRRRRHSYHPNHPTREVIVDARSLEPTDCHLSEAVGYVIDIDPRLEGFDMSPRLSDDSKFVILDVPVWAELNTDED